MAITFTPSINPEFDISMTRVTTLSAAKIWQAWTTPELLCQWFCPKPWHTIHAEVELFVGGKFNSVMRPPADFPSQEDVYNNGSFIYVDTHKILGFTNLFTAGFAPQVVEGLPFVAFIVLTENEGGTTTYTAIAKHPTVEAKAMHENMGFEAGWGAAFDQLVALMS